MRLTLSQYLLPSSKRGALCVHDHMPEVGLSWQMTKVLARPCLVGHSLYMMSLACNMQTARCTIKDVRLFDVLWRDTFHFCRVLLG